MTEAPQKKNVALIFADLSRSALGTKSRIQESLRGVPVLRRTIERLEQVEALQEIIVFCPAQDESALRELTVGTAAVLIGLQETVPVSKRVPYRKWSLDSWRGGINEATVFDEQSYTGEMVQILRDREVYSVLAVAAEAVLVDPQLCAELIEYHHENEHVMRFTFTQAPPGLVPCVYRLDMLHELVLAQTHIGQLLCYDPENPHADYINMECAYRLDLELCVAADRAFAGRISDIGFPRKALCPVVRLLRARERYNFRGPFARLRHAG